MFKAAELITTATMKHISNEYSVFPVAVHLGVVEIVSQLGDAAPAKH